MSLRLSAAAQLEEEEPAEGGSVGASGSEPAVGAASAAVRESTPRLLPRPLRGPLRQPLDVGRVLGLSLTLFLHAALLLFLSIEHHEHLQQDAAEVATLEFASEAAGLEVSFIDAAPAEPVERPLPVDSSPELPIERPPQALVLPRAAAPKAPPVKPQAESALPVPVPPPEQIEPLDTAPAATQQAPATAVAAQDAAEPSATAAMPEAVAAPPTEASTSRSAAPAAQTRAQRARAAREQQAYIRELMAWLLRHRVYPDAAKKNKTEGTVLVRFTLNREGQVLSAELAGSSGSALLDQAALDVLRRASPGPALPASMAREQLSISLPIEYSLLTP